MSGGATSIFPSWRMCRWAAQCKMQEVNCFFFFFFYVVFFLVCNSAAIFKILIYWHTSILFNVKKLLFMVAPGYSVYDLYGCISFVLALLLLTYFCECVFSPLSTYVMCNIILNIMFNIMLNIMFNIIFNMTIQTSCKQM